jgi:AraC-like DNA-binding protein
MAPRSTKPTAPDQASIHLDRAVARGNDLYMFGRAVYLPGGWHGPRRMNDYLLVTILEGGVTIDCDGRRLEAGPGEGVILPPRSRQLFRFQRDGKSVHGWCKIALDITNRRERELLRAAGRVGAVPAAVNILIEEGISVPIHVGPQSSLAMQTLAKACLLRFAAHVAERMEATPQRNPAVERATEVLAMNPTRFRSAAELARYCGMSYSRFRKLFQDSQGETPTAMIWRLKTSHAVQLIRATGLTLAEVADQCGFSNAFHLSRCVKKHAGLSPRELRKMGGLNARED